VIWSELEIRGNRVISCGNAPNYLTSLEYTSGILFDATFGGILSENIVKDCSIRGIEIACHSYGQTGKVVFHIMNNQVISSLTTTAYACIIDVAYTDCVFNIIGNTFKNAGARALYVASPVTNNTIVNVSGNTCIVPTTGTTYALQLFQVQDGAVTNNLCIGVTALFTRSHGNVKRNSMNTYIGTVDSTTTLVG
jgi:hypothetical protein